MIISLDADDVIWDCIGTLAKWHNKEYGTKLTRSDFSTYDLAKVLVDKTPIRTSNDALERITAFCRTDEFANMPLLSHAYDAIRELAKEHEIIIITSRHQELREVTEYQCKRDLNGFIREIHHSYNAYTGWEGRKKGEICVDNKVALHCDDSPRYAQECQHHGIRCALMDAPWNQNHEEIYDATRVFDHRDLHRMVEAIK